MFTSRVSSSSGQLSRSAHGRRSGFTLIELLTVIAIIGILAAILLPVIGRARESAKSARCIGNLRQVGVAVHAHAQESKGLLPATGFYGIAPYYNRDARNFQHALLPYLGLKRATNWSTVPEESAYAAVLHCPSYKGAENGKGYLAQENLTLPDGTVVKPWGRVTDSNGNSLSPKAQPLSKIPTGAWAIRDFDATIDGLATTAHPNGHNTLFFDGSVKRVAL